MGKYWHFLFILLYFMNISILVCWVSNIVSLHSVRKFDIISTKMRKNCASLKYALPMGLALWDLVHRCRHL